MGNMMWVTMMCRREVLKKRKGQTKAKSKVSLGQTCRSEGIDVI
jgi:hypothetical protein